MFECFKESEIDEILVPQRKLNANSLAWSNKERKKEEILYAKHVP